MNSHNASAAAARVVLHPLGQGPLADYSHDAFPSSVSSWRKGTLILPDCATHFGFVHSGTAQLTCPSGTFQAAAGMYFSVPGKCRIQGAGSGLVASRIGYQGFFQLGGPIEQRGRLRYIDGCTDSLLIAPVMKGDACLNLLHVPPHTDQTQHTHPSLRVGLIVAGRGACHTVSGQLPLAPELAFVIPADIRHSFHTADAGLTIIAYHPDSDFGPSHEEHPMLNRTKVVGIR